MLDAMKYTNHLGEIIEFGVGGIIVNTNDFRNYEWTYNSRFKKITNFEKEIAKKTLPILIVGSDAKAKADRIFEVIEKDVLAKQRGSIEINGYSLKGFFYSSQSPDYTADGFLKLEIAFVSDLPMWTKESIYNFNLSTASKKGLNYPHNYGYDYTSEMMVKSLNNKHFFETNFRIIFHGACVNPLINIANHSYRVYGTVEKNESLVIDSVEKKVYLVKDDGSIVNKFGDRDKDSYIFEPIPSGVSPVSWESDFAFDVVLVEQRSAPIWN